MRPLVGVLKISGHRERTSATSWASTQKSVSSMFAIRHYSTLRVFQSMIATR